MQSIGEAIFSSSEYVNHVPAISNRDYVRDLYRAYLFREPEPGGWDARTAVLDSNAGTRADVRNGFAWSAEFQLKVRGMQLI
jgi:hypothetical protein